MTKQQVHNVFSPCSFEVVFRGVFITGYTLMSTRKEILQDDILVYNSKSQNQYRKLQDEIYPNTSMSN